MTSYNFHFRPSSVEGRAGSLFIRVIHDRRSKSVQRSYRVLPDEWSPYSKDIIIPRLSSSRRFELLDIQSSMGSDLLRLEQIVGNLRAHGAYTVQDVCHAFNQDDSVDTVISFTDSLAQELSSQDRPRTARAYRSAARSLVKYNSGRDVPLCDISFSLIRSYEQYLLDNGLKMNTISFYMRNLRAVYHRAVSSNLIRKQDKNPFENVFTGVYETKRRSLDQHDMNELARLETLLTKRLAVQCPAISSDGHYLVNDYANSKRLKNSLLYYLFQYHSRGMSFIDLAYLKKSEVGDDTIIYKRKKTGYYMEVKITRPMRRIIKHFSRVTNDSAYVFPIICDESKNHRTQYENALNNQNKRLKTLAAMAGISKPLTTHVARHTWATIAKRMGYSVSLISEGLGHKDPRITMIYLASFERAALDEISTRISGAVRVA